MTQYGPWEIFNGGECPLADGEMAQVQCRFQSREQTETDPPRNDWDWQTNRKQAGAIIAFRRVIEPKPAVHKAHANGFGVWHGYSSVGRNLNITITGEDIKAEWVE